MNGTIISTHSAHLSTDADQDGCPHTGPTATIVEFGPDSLAGVSRGQNPQWDDDQEKTSNVQDQNKGFDKRELRRKQDIESDGEDDDCNSKASAVPWLGLIIGVVQLDQSLNSKSRRKAKTHDIALPCASSDPA